MEEKQQRGLIMKAVSEAEMCADFIVKYFEGSERDVKLNSLESTVKNYCILDSQIKERASSVENMMNEHSQKLAPTEEAGEDANLENLENMFDEDLNSRVSKAIQNVDVLKHQIMRKYKEKLQAIIKKVDKKNQENQDEELMCTDESETYVDPITKTTIVDPVFSKVCKHIFSRDTITQQINAHPRQYTKCPYVGCNKRIALADLETDYELAQVLERIQLEKQ